MRVKKWGLLLTVLLILFTAQTAAARELMQGDTCTIGANQVIEGDLFVLCRVLEIDGQVNGNILGAGVTIIINGTITGNIYLIAGQLDMHASLTGDLHFAGGVLNVTPPSSDDLQVLTPELVIDGEVLAASLSVNLAENTVVNEGIINIGYQLIVSGTVKGNISLWGSALTINGTVEGDIDATVGDPASDASQIETLLIPFPIEAELFNPGLIVNEQGKVNGTLRYSGPVAGIIQGDLLHPPQFDKVSTLALQAIDEPGALTIYFEQVMREFWTLLVIGIIGLIFAPRLLQTPIPNLRLRPVSSFSIGMLTFILSFPIALMGLLLSLLIIVILAILRLDALLLAVSIFLGVINVGATSFFYFMALAVARVVVALYLGRWVVRLAVRREIYGGLRYVYLGLFAGVLLLAMLASIPTVGWLVNAAALFMGLGTILMVFMEYLGTVRAAATPMGGYYTPSPLAQARHLTATTTPREPPIITPDTGDSPSVGTTNLPEGFDFDFFDDDRELH